MELMTLKEALRGTRDLLAGISVPAGLIRQIGAPILAAMENLEECVRAIGDAENGNGNGPAEKGTGTGDEVQETGKAGQGFPAADDTRGEDGDGPAFGEGEI